MSWQHCLLGDLVDIKGGGTPSRSVESYWNGGIPWATVKDFKSNVILETEENISELGAKKSATNIIPKGTIIIPTRMSLGKVAIAGKDVAINQDLKALVLKDNHTITTEFLFWFLRYSGEEFERAGKGATVKGITVEFLKNVQVPLPPLATQQHIARVLEQADQLRKQAQQMESELKQLAQSLFLEMFGDLVSNARNWPKDVLGKHAKRITVGHVGVTSEHYTENGISFLRTQNVRPMRVNFSDIKQITPQFHESLKKSTLKQGDVLVSRVGANRGMACIVPPALDGANCANVLIARLADSISPVFVSYLINGDYGARTLLGDSVGSAQGVINTQKLQEWVLPFPPITLQKKFEFSYEKIQSQLDAVALKKDALDDLFNALMQRAFNGELTTPERKAA